MKEFFKKPNVKKYFYYSINIVSLAVMLFLIASLFTSKSNDRNSIILSVNEEEAPAGGEYFKLQESIDQLEKIFLDKLQEVGSINPKHETENPVIKTGPKVAIILNNVGLSKGTTDSALDLPPEVTLSFSPYSTNIEEYTAKAEQIGHEVMLNLPLEPISYPYDDPGPLGLISNLSKEENISRLNAVLAKTKKFSGVLTNKEEKFSQSPVALRPILATLKQKSILLVFSGEDSKVIDAESERIKFPLFYTDIKIDEKIDANSIETQLKAVEQLANQYGGVIVTGNPYPITIRKIQEWIYSLEKKNIQLVPISAITSS